MKPKKSKKKIFRVFATQEVYYFMDVEAKNEEEAERIAEDADAMAFEKQGYGDWDVICGSTEQIK